MIERPAPWPGLAALGLTTVGVLVGLATGVVPTWPGAVHLVALPPLDLMADARWLLTSATSWLVFVPAALALLGWRIVVLALLLGAPGRPAWGLASRIYVSALVPAYLVAQLDFVAHAVLYSRIYATALWLAAIVALLWLPLAWTAGRRLRERWTGAFRQGLRLEVTLPYLAAVLALGWLVEGGGRWVVAGGIVATAVLGLVVIRAFTVVAAPRAGLTLSLFGLAVLVAVAAVVTSRDDEWRPTTTPREGSLLIMSGINSSSGEGAIFELDPLPLGFGCDQTYYFSYAGTGDGQPRGVATCPILTGAAYEPEHTQRPFAEQIALLEAQADPLEPPVFVLAHSQAAWVAWAAAADGRLPDDTHLVLIGPFPASPVGYPPPDETGPGRVAGDLLRLLEPLPQLADFDFVVDAPLSREILAEADAASTVLDEPIPADHRALAVTSTTDLPLMPSGWRVDHAVDACPVREAHPYLPLTPGLLRQLERFLDERPPEACARWPEHYRRLTAAVSVPPHGT